MPGQVIDALRQERDLDLRRSRVGLGRAVLLDDLFLYFLRQAHSSPSSRQSQQSAGSRRKAAAASRDRVAPRLRGATPLGGIAGDAYYLRRSLPTRRWAR